MGSLVHPENKKVVLFLEKRGLFLEKWLLLEGNLKKSCQVRKNGFWIEGRNFAA
jgi:hypothetical protein